MVETLIKPDSTTGEYTFDSNDCLEPGCPGPKQGPNGNLVCGLEDTDDPTIIGGIGSASLVNCIGVAMANPGKIEDQVENEDNCAVESEEKDEPDIYVC